MASWECRVCLHVHEGDEPPERCPVCGAPASEFTPLDEDEIGDENEDENGN
jgi:rubrerythrin